MKRKSKNKLLGICFLVYFLIVCLFIIVIYFHKRNEIIINVRKNLKNATNMVYEMVGDKFLVNVMNNHPEKNSEKLIWDKVRKITKYNFIHGITTAGVEGVIKGDIYDIIGGLESENNLKNHIRKIMGDDPYHFNLSLTKPKVAEGWKNIIKCPKKEMYVEKPGRKGVIFSLYSKRIILSDGKACFVFSGIYLKDINEETRAAVFEALLWFILFIFLSIIIIFLLFSKLKEDKKTLEDKTIKIKFLNSELKNTNEILKNKNMSLADANDKVKELWRNAKQANETKDQFFANMNHDFRTPLNAIIGYSELISSAPNDPLEVADQSNKINKNAKIMLNFTEDLLDYIRLKNNSLEYVEEIVNLNTIIEHIDASFSLRALEDGKFLDVELDPKLPLAIESSNRRVFQIINNLVSNAIKFTEKGDEISVKIKKKNGNEFYIIVKDSGIGIEKSKQADIFGEFKKLDNKNNGSGVGLGLFITKSIVQIMGGTISIDSEENEYTEFIATLPLKEMKQNFEVENIYEKLLERKDPGDSIEYFHNQLKVYIENMASEIHTVLNNLPFVENVYDLIFPLTHKRKTSSKIINFDEAVYYLEKANYEAKENNDREKVEKYLNLIMDLIDKIPYLKVSQIQQNKTISIKEKQVLIVDDARDNSAILQKKLSTIGIGADVADSGKRALEMLKEKQYEVMFIDINMPVMNGEELFAQMCKLKIPGIKFAYTADAVKTTKNRLIKLGFDDVVRKPVQENILCGLIKHHLRPPEPEVMHFKPRK